LQQCNAQQALLTESAVMDSASAKSFHISVKQRMELLERENDELHEAFK
jgi:hypothetical protein